MKYYSLTNPQKSIYSVEEFYKGTNINNIGGVLNIKSDVNLDKLNEAVNLSVLNNKSFSLRFKMLDNEPIQFFEKTENEIFEKKFFKNYEEVHSFTSNLTNYVFDIYNEKLYKFILYKLENGYGGVILLIHHIISDAATFSLIATEIIENYLATLNGKELPKKDYSYEDFIKSEEEYVNSSKFKKDEEYWNNLYSSIPETAMVPSIHEKQNSEHSSKSSRKEYLIDEKLLNIISNFCRKNNISNFNFFMAIFGIYLSKISNLKDVVIGTPILNRTNFNEKHTMGMFINTAPFRMNLTNNISFLDFLNKVSVDSLAMLRHQKYPYEMLLKNLREKRK